MVNRFPDPARPAPYVVVAVVVRALLAFIAAKATHQHHEGFWGMTGADSSSYTEPIESLLAVGRYQPDYRMPGYGAVYALFRVVSSATTSMNLVLVAQVLLSGLSVYSLARTAHRLSGRADVFFGVYGVYLISLFVSVYDVYFLTESLCTSALVLGASLIVSGFERSSAPRLFAAGALLAWTIFLRPVYAGAFVLLLAVVLWERPPGWFRALVLLAAPFVVTDAAWAARNWAVHRRFAPLTTTVFYPHIERSYLRPLISLVQSWGGSALWWESDSDMAWFEAKLPGTTVGTLEPSTADEPPGWIFSPEFTRPQLLALRDDIRRYGAAAGPDEAVDDALALRLTLASRAVYAHHPVRAYLLGPLVALKRFVLQSGAPFISRPFAELGAEKRLIVVAFTGLFGLVVTLGVLGAAWLASARRSVGSAAVAMLAVYAFIHPLALRVSEVRYLVPSYPFLVVCAVWLVAAVLHRASAQRHAAPSAESSQAT